MTYEYECRKCGHQWEEEQSIKDEPVLECPVCHEPEAQRIICGSGSFVLNGRGWARDSYS